MSSSADGDVGRAQAGELVGLGGPVVVDGLGVRHRFQRGDDELGSETSDVTRMTEALEMPLQLVDHDAVEVGQTLDERLRTADACHSSSWSRSVSFQSIAASTSSRLQLLDVRLLGPQPLRQHLDERSDLVEMPIGQRDEQRILVREVLIQRTDRDLGSGSHVVRCRGVVPALVEMRAASPRRMRA